MSFVDKCPACPLRQSTLACPAVTTGHFRFCELVAEGRTDYIDYLLEEAGVKPTIIPIKPPCDPSEDKRLAARALMELSREARSCPHREACGCVYAYCLPGGFRPGEKVSLQDCVECIKNNKYDTAEKEKSQTALD